MSPSAREYLQHILDETTYIMTSSIGLNKEAFVQGETLKRAYVRSLEIIGEAWILCIYTLFKGRKSFGTRH